MDAILKFLTDYKDALGLLLGSGVLIVLIRFLASLFMRWWRGRLRVDIKAFDVITDPATLLPRLYGEENNPDVLSHHRIPYQRRDPNRDIQSELRAALNETRHLLITAPTGIGKTREAATLAASLMNEGWRVIRVKTGWLDVPKELPAELNNDRRRVLILLDDLNGLFRTGGFMQSPKAEQMPTLGQPSYHDRLRDMLDAFERMCGENEIRVIATARDETDEWRALDFRPRDVLWRRFKRVELADPLEGAIVELLEESVVHANMQAVRDDFRAIARENDGTFANVVLNLRRAQKANTPITRVGYSATLNGSWREVYERALRKYSAVRYIYDAIDLLQQVEIEFERESVKSIASLLWGSNVIQSFARQFQVSLALRYLVDKEKILAQSEDILLPRDGQIEAKGTRIDWKTYAFGLKHRVFLPLFAVLSRMVEQWFLILGMALNNQNEPIESATLLEKLNQFNPVGSYNTFAKI